MGFEGEEVEAEKSEEVEESLFLDDALILERRFGVGEAMVEEFERYRVTDLERWWMTTSSLFGTCTKCYNMDLRGSCHDRIWIPG